SGVKMACRIQAGGTDPAPAGWPTQDRMARAATQTQRQHQWCRHHPRSLTKKEAPMRWLRMLILGKRGWLTAEIRTALAVRRAARKHTAELRKLSTAT